MNQQQQLSFQIHTPTNYLTNFFTSTFSHYLPISNNDLQSNNNNSDYANNGSLSDNNNNNNNQQPYFKPFFVVDVIWNLGFVFVSTFVLFSTFNENPITPLRVWIFGYSLQCLFHVFFVYYQFCRRECGGFGRGSLPDSQTSHISVVKKLESANTIASSFWWVFGFYLIVSGGQSLLQDSPHLYWLVVVFLALDVFFMIFCIGMACVICLFLFCCIPIVAIAYAMTIRGASEEDIKQLPTYRFHHSHAPSVSAMNAIGELAVQFEDPECCICLTRFTEGAEICTLPCKHTFHYGCISTWLRINAICPLCKYNIKAKGDDLV